MKGRTPTIKQKHFHDDLCRHVGCVACRFEGGFNDYVSVHHIDGRTKPEAHWLVLPLCGAHHQDNGTAVAVHPYKARFEERYGAQMDLLRWCIEWLQQRDMEVPDGALIAAGMIGSAQ